jgi:mannose-1-phosphate guanylyltransferase
MKNLSDYKAIILAGGKGTRLYPVTKEIPKPLLPINKKPIINYLVDLFQSYGISEIAVLVSKDFQQDFKWWKKRYYPSLSSGRALNIRLVEEKEQLGTFGGIYLLKDWIGQNKFFLTNGDELKKINLAKMAEFHNQIKPLGTIALVEVEDPQHYGVVVCNSVKVKDFLEKPENPPSNYVNSGLYLLNPEIINYHPGPEFLMIEKDIFPKLAKEDKLAGFKFKGKWTDCGTWERYEKAISEWQS